MDVNRLRPAIQLAFCILGWLYAGYTFMSGDRLGGVFLFCVTGMIVLVGYIGAKTWRLLRSSKHAPCGDVRNNAWRRLSVWASAITVVISVALIIQLFSGPVGR